MKLQCFEINRVAFEAAAVSFPNAKNCVKITPSQVPYPLKSPVSEEIRRTSATGIIISISCLQMEQQYPAAEKPVICMYLRNNHYIVN
jgi:hypothetical protein